MRDGTRAADELESKYWIFIDVRCGREFSHHLRPIRVHLISQDHWQRSVYALTELKTIYLNDNSAVRPDVNKRIGRIDFRRWHLISFVRGCGQIDVQRN